MSPQSFRALTPSGVAVLSYVAAVVLRLLEGFGPAKQGGAMPITAAIGYEWRPRH